MATIGNISGAAPAPSADTRVKRAGAGGGDQSFGQVYTRAQNKASEPQVTEIRMVDYFSFGEGRQTPDNCDDLEYNVYRQDGLGIAGHLGDAVRLSSTGELLIDPLATRLKRQINDVSEGRIKLYNQQKAAGKSNDDIKLALQAYDAALPADYKQYVSPHDGTDVRYDYRRPEKLIG